MGLDMRQYILFIIRWLLLWKIQIRCIHNIISLPLLLLLMGIGEAVTFKKGTPAGVAVATVGVPVTLLGNGLADTCFHQSVLLPIARRENPFGNTFDILVFDLG